jgi:hypothetical protein
VVRSTFDQGNHGSVVILNTVNLRKNNYNSTSEDGTSLSSAGTKSISSNSSGSNFGTTQLHDDEVSDAVQFNETKTFNSSVSSVFDTVQFNETGGTVMFNETLDTVRYLKDSKDSGGAESPILPRKRALSNSLSSIPTPRVLDSDYTRSDIEKGHEGEDERERQNRLKLKASVTTYPTSISPSGKESREVGTQTDLPLDLYYPSHLPSYFLF